VPCTVALLLLCLTPAYGQVVRFYCSTVLRLMVLQCLRLQLRLLPRIEACSKVLHAAACVFLHAPDIRLCMLQPALGGGQQPVNDQLATGAPVSQQAVQPANQLGTQKPAVTVQNVPAAVAANRLGFTDRDTLPPVSMQRHGGHHLSRAFLQIRVVERHDVPAPGAPTPAAHTLACSLQCWEHSLLFTCRGMSLCCACVH
jgi:hypothetical protein